MKRVTLLLFSLILSFAACKPTEVQQALDNADYDFSNKVSIMEASSEDISANVVDCKGSGKKEEVCVVICHRPPGNPYNMKTKVLPLSATLAHLNHGHTTEERDFLGACESNTSSDDGATEDESDSSEEGEETENSSGEDGSATEDNGSDSDNTNNNTNEEDESSSTTEEPSDELPQWCLDNLDIDADCNGIHDIDGSLMY